MPLASSGSALGAGMAAAAPSTDVAGIAAWAAIAEAICAHIVSSAVVLPGLLVAGGTTVTGTGIIVVVPGALGVTLAAAAGSLDAVGLAKWNAIALAACATASTWLALPTAFVANPAGGPVTGTGTIVATGGLGAALVVAAGSLDAVGIASWTAIGSAIELTATSAALVLPIAFVSPPGGGAVTGVGSLA